MKKQFFFNVILLVIINLVVKPVYVLWVESQVQNTVGTADFGQYFYHLNFVYLFQFLGDFGLQTWNNQHVAKNRGGVSTFLMSVIVVKILLSLVWLAVVAFGSFFFEGLQVSWILLVGINLLLSSWFLLIRSFLSGLGQYSLDSWLSSLDKILMICIVSGILYYQRAYGEFTVIDFIIGQMISLSLAVLIGIIFLFKHVGYIKAHIDVRKISSIMKASIPYAVVLFLTMSYHKLDGFFLGAFAGDTGIQAGIYAASYRIYDAANMFLYIIPTLVLPMFSYMIAQKQDLSDFYAVVVRWVFLLLGPILQITLLYTEDILTWMYLVHIPEKTKVLTWLMTSSILVSFAYLFGSLSMALDKVHKLIPVFLSGLILNIILLTVLVPGKGAYGAAIATLITQVFVFIGQWLVVRKLINLQLPWQVIAKGLFYWFSLFLAGWWLKNGAVLPIPWAISTSLIISLPLALLFKMLEYSDLRLILSRKNNFNE